MNATLLATVRALPLGERIELAQSLWESIAQEGYEPDLTPTQAAELDRRGQAHEKNPDDVVPWETVRTAIEKRLPGKA